MAGKREIVPSAAVSAPDDSARNHSESGPRGRVAKPRYEIRTAIVDDAADLAPRLRQRDVDEIEAATGRTPLDALWTSLRVSHDPKAGLVDGRIVCLFGIGRVTALSPVGVPWLLASPELEDHARAFLRLSRSYMEHAQVQCRYLVNYVDARNLKSIKWLKWLGFKIEPAQPFGYAGLPFHRFTMGEPCYV